MTTTFEAAEADREENNSELIAALESPVADDVESTFEIEVINDAERGRWIAVLGADAIGELTYRFVGGRVVLLSTWVDHAYRNQRVATELVPRVLNEIEQTGKKITIICPVVGEFIARNREYLDLVDPIHPGSGAAILRGLTPETPEQQLSGLEHDLSETKG
jgi:predicted GNAT family acetyltransferase